MAENPLSDTQDPPDFLPAAQPVHNLPIILRQKNGRNYHNGKKADNADHVFHIAHRLVHNLRHYLYLKIFYKNIHSFQDIFFNAFTVHAQFLFHPVTAVSYKNIKLLFKQVNLPKQFSQPVKNEHQQAPDTDTCGNADQQQYPRRQEPLFNMISFLGFLQHRMKHTDKSKGKKKRSSQRT